MTTRASVISTITILKTRPSASRKPLSPSGNWGAALYRELLGSLQQQGFHVAIAGIALPNEASVKLHERLGFAKAAHFAEVGRKFGQWVDVGYWQKMFGNA